MRTGVFIINHKLHFFVHMFLLDTDTNFLWHFFFSPFLFIINLLSDSFMDYLRVFRLLSHFWLNLWKIFNWIPQHFEHPTHRIDATWTCLITRLGIFCNFRDNVILHRKRFQNLLSYRKLQALIDLNVVLLIHLFVTNV